METSSRSNGRAVLAALLAPCVIPLLVAIYIWLIFHFSEGGAELARIFRPEDLWPFLLWTLVATEIVTWCIAFPIFLRARSRNTATMAGMCIVSGAIPLLISLIAALFSGASVLVVGLIVAAHGVLVAALFSLIAGLSRDTPRSMFLQPDIKTGYE